MQYYWLQDQEAQQHFKFIWEKGTNNKADYFTKHHPPGHHQTIRAQYIQHCQTEQAGRNCLHQGEQRQRSEGVLIPVTSSRRTTARP